MRLSHRLTRRQNAPSGGLSGREKDKALLSGFPQLLGRGRDSRAGFWGYWIRQTQAVLWGRCAVGLGSGSVVLCP
jgi:hypothetical protein